MSNTDSFLLRIAEAILDRNQTLGLLVHGSYAAGTFHRHSDVDLIWVTKTDRRQRFVRSIDGVEIDVFASSPTEIDKIIHSTVWNNNNLVLYAFVRGRSLIDLDGSVAELITIAGQIWARGPTPPSREETERLEVASRISAAVAARIGIRAMQSSEWCEIAQLQSGTIFVESLYAYCRIHQLWASALWEMLKWHDAKYQDVLAVIRNYLAEPSLQSRLDAIRQLTDATINTIASENKTQNSMIHETGTIS